MFGEPEQPESGSVQTEYATSLVADDEAFLDRFEQRLKEGKDVTLFKHAFVSDVLRSSRPDRKSVASAALQCNVATTLRGAGTCKSLIVGLVCSWHRSCPWFLEKDKHDPRHFLIGTCRAAW